MSNLKTKTQLLAAVYGELQLIYWTFSFRGGSQSISVVSAKLGSTVNVSGPPVSQKTGAEKKLFEESRNAA